MKPDGGRASGHCEYPTPDGPSTRAMLLAVALAASCSSRAGSSYSETSDADDERVSQADHASGAMGGVADNQPEQQDRAACRLPREEDLRIEQPENESEMHFNEVLASHLDQLYQTVGRFANGDVKVLKGTMDALLSGSTVAAGEERAIDSARAVAYLTYDEDAVTPLSGELALFDPETRQLVRVRQNSDRASVCGIVSFHSPCGHGTGCWDCLPAFGSVSDSLSLSFSAFGNNLDPSELRIDVKAALAVVPPDELSMVDILTLNSTARSLLPTSEPELDGDTYVFPVGELLSTDRVDESGCTEWVRYEAEWFVREDCLLDYGIREFSVVESVVFCPIDQG